MLDLHRAAIDKLEFKLDPVRLLKAGADSKDAQEGDRVSGASIDANDVRRLGDVAAAAAGVSDKATKSRSQLGDSFSLDVDFHKAFFAYMERSSPSSPMPPSQLLPSDPRFGGNYSTLAPVPAPTPMPALTPAPTPIPAPTTPRPTLNQADANQQASAAGAYTSAGTVSGECCNCPQGLSIKLLES